MNNIFFTVTLSFVFCFITFQASAQTLSNAVDADPLLLAQVIGKTCKAAFKDPTSNHESRKGASHLRLFIENNMVTGSVQVAVGDYAYRTWKNEIVGSAPSKVNSVQIAGKKIQIFTSSGNQYTLTMGDNGFISWVIDPTKNPAYSNPRVVVSTDSICEQTTPK